MPGISIDVMSEDIVLFILAARAGSVMLVAMTQEVMLIVDAARPPRYWGCQNDCSGKW
jgi:hypothetical protein